ncbi:hypothetical protein Rleg5DRAFT_6955 [Rhizobium leguminosarum bv. viciae WSM1455]|nr:hypothetical protein Rleg5DRAFT_6955 [Rhizobium leguminosarum bv. viciae WSM1455]
MTSETPSYALREPFVIWLDRPLKQSKFARGILRFCDPRRITGIVCPPNLAGDSTRFVRQELARELTCFETVSAAQAQGAQCLLIGVCPTDAVVNFTQEMRAAIQDALTLGMTVGNPLHAMPSEDGYFRAQPKTWRSFVNLRASSGRRLFAGHPRKAYRVLTAGNDCSVGKMTAAIVLTNELLALGIRAAFLATGQTGLVINGGVGLPADHLEGDFIAGEVEACIRDLEDQFDVIVIEGQGSLLHPAYASVTVGLLNGARPHAVVLCEEPARRHLKFYDDLPVPSLESEWAAIQALSPSVFKPALLGVSRFGPGRGGEAIGLECRDVITEGAREWALSVCDRIERDWRLTLQEMKYP